MEPKTDAATQQTRIAELEKTLALAQQADNTPQVLSTLAELGQAYLAVGEAPKALTQFEHGCKLAKKTGLMEAEAQFLGFTGLALKQIGNFDFALRQFRKSSKVARQIPHNALACDSYMQMALLLAHTGEETKAVSQLSRAMKIAVDTNDLPRKMRVASLLADNFYRMEAFDKAVEYYVIAQEVARDLNNRPAECSFLTKVGNVFLLEGEIESAIGQYERALKVAEPLEDANAEINILGGLFRAYALADNIELAQSYGDKAINLAETIGHVAAELANLHALASILIEHEHYQQSIVYLEKGLKLSLEHGDDDWLLLFQSSLGFVAYNLNELTTASAHYHSALTLAVECQNTNTEAMILTRIGAIQADQGEYEQALTTSKRALQLARELENYALLGEQQSLMAFLYHDMGDQETA
ncbi:hypothetical protein ACFLYO_11410, partial [Chloroflexota bacterium]